MLCHSAEVMEMAQVTRTMVREPSNSKCPGASRHLSIRGMKFVGGIADIAEGPATIVIAGSFARGSGIRARQERHTVSIPVIVTGIATDVVTGICDGGSQQFEILFTGCVRVESI
jgi:hypothetical protein